MNAAALFRPALALLLALPAGSWAQSGSAAAPAAAASKPSIQSTPAPVPSTGAKRTRSGASGEIDKELHAPTQVRAPLSSSLSSQAKTETGRAAMKSPSTAGTTDDSVARCMAQVDPAERARCSNPLPPKPPAPARAASGAR
jgi:hypothetical protein